jgi:hypothetical protein
LVVRQAVFRREVSEFMAIKPGGAALGGKPDRPVRLNQDLADIVVVR